MQSMAGTRVPPAAAGFWCRHGLFHRFGLCCNEMRWECGDFGLSSSSSSVSGQLTSGVHMMYFTSSAAKTSGGQVVTRGSDRLGGDSSSVSSQLSSGVDTIYSNSAAFTGKKSDGSVVTWGDSDRGGESSSVSSYLTSGVAMTDTATPPKLCPTATTAATMTTATTTTTMTKTTSPTPTMRNRISVTMGSQLPVFVRVLWTLL